MSNEFNYIGKSGVRRLDGLEKATGKAVFTLDMQLPDMLYARILDSPYAHARIVSMDTSKAEALPGVRCVLRYDDPEMVAKSKITPKTYIRNDQNTYSGFRVSTNPLGDGIAYFHLENLGVAIAADTECIAEEALRLVDIEWEELPFVLDAEEALLPGAPIACPERVAKDETEGNLRYTRVQTQGDIEAGLAAADKIIDIEFKRRSHTFMGPELDSCLSEWYGDNLYIWPHYQHPEEITMWGLLDWFNIPLSRVMVQVLYQGAMFGEGSEDYSRLYPQLWTISAELAQRTKRPVKAIWNRRKTFHDQSRDEGVYRYKVGFKNDGKITAIQARNIFARYGNRGWQHFMENTSVPNIDGEELRAWVNRGPAWSCRCEQQPNSHSMTMVMNEVADAAGLDPTEVHLMNDGFEGEDAIHLAEYKHEHGLPERDSLRECIEAGKVAVDWDNKWHAPGTKELPNGKMHGIAVNWTHEWGGRQGYSQTSTAAISIRNDGSVNILGQQADVGVNSRTTYAQVVADELGWRVEDINFRSFDYVGYGLMTPDGSVCMVSNGYVMRKVARSAKRLLLEMVTDTGRFADKDGRRSRSYDPEYPGLTADDLDVKDGVIFEKANPENKHTAAEVLQTRWNGDRHPRGISNQDPLFVVETSFTPNNYPGTPGDFPSYLTRQAHFMEVEVDPETGYIEVTKVVTVNDVGKAISPEACIGQAYGGAIVGVSRGRNEEQIWDSQTGVMLTPNLIEYKIATTLDYGPSENILIETGLGPGPYGLVGIGEDNADLIPCLVGCAVQNAIGVWINDFPITPDKVLKALGKA